MTPSDIRAMRPDDVDPVVEVFRRSLRGMRRAIGLPEEYDSSRLDGRVRHLLGTDPDGAWVAVGGDDAVVGFAQAARREGLWVLAHLFVDPPAQGAGLGRALLERALDYGEGCESGLIASTPLPAAMTLYARLPGFVVHPTVSASGFLDRRALPAAPDVRAGRSADRELAARVGRELRGGPHGPDLDYLLEAGSTLLVVPDRGYAVASGEQLDLLAATDVAAARQLLSEALRRTREDAPVTIKRIGAQQPWAVELATRAGLELRPWGPLVERSCPALERPYLADGAFC